MAGAAGFEPATYSFEDCSTVDALQREGHVKC